MRSIISLSILAIILLSGCVTKPEIVTPANVQPNTNNQANSNLNQEIANIKVTEIQDPDLNLPGDLNPGQIQSFFQAGNYYYALVRQSSMNILLDTPKNFQAKFVGVLKAETGAASWSKYLEIKDKNATDKNNPYYLWDNKNQLYLSVVDQNGAGSGEGSMKVFQINDDQAGLIGCYYYPGSDSPENYFSDTRNFQKFDNQPMESCNNLEIKIFN